MEQEEIVKTESKIVSKFSSWLKDPYNLTFFIILIGAFIIRFIIFKNTITQPLWWDEADYLATGKKWGLGLDIRDIWYYRRGFFWPLFSALFFMLGIGEIGVRFSILLFSVGLVAVSYFLIKKMFDEKSALFVAIGVTFSWIPLFFTGRVLTEIPSSFFLLLSLLFFWKGYALKEGNKFLYLFGLFYALSLLTRFQYTLFALPFLVFIFTKEKFHMFKNKHLWLTFLVFFIVLLPHLIFYWTHYGNIFTDILSHYFGISGVSETPSTPRTLTTLFDYFKDLPYMLTKLIFFLFIIGIVFFFLDFITIDKLFSSENVQKKMFVLLWIITPFLVLGYITQLVEQRYILATLPFLFLIVAAPLFKLENLFGKNVIFLIFLIFSGIMIFSIGNNLSNYTWANQLINNKLTSYQEVMSAGMWIKENSNSQDGVITSSLPQITYYAERSAYELGNNETDFEDRIKKYKPRYLVLSIFEQSPDWSYNYPSKHNTSVIPVQVYAKEQQPLLIIYEFKI